MKEKNYLYAPQWDNLIFYNHSNSVYNRSMTLTKESQEAMKNLLNELSHIACTRRDGYWDMWFPVEKGTIEAFGNYEELYQDGEYSSYDEYVEAWENSYTKDICWHKLIVVYENGYTVLQVDDSIFVNVNPNEENSYFETDVKDVLFQLTCEVRKIRRMIEKDEYAKYLEDNLPYEYRFGTISRKKLWEIDSDRAKVDLDDLTDAEIREFVKYIRESKGFDDKENIVGIKNMTAGRYYEFCSYCYLAARFEGVEKLTPKEMYAKFGDDRDGGLGTLDLESEVDFEKWYNLTDQEKWEIENPSHMWELSEGRSYTRVHLFLAHNDNGYYLSLSGGVHAMTPEVVRMYNSLKDHNIPVRIYDGEAIAKKIMGQDEVGIVPITERPYTYWYGGFPTGNLLNYINIDDYDTEKVIQLAKWFEMPSLRLATDTGDNNGK